MNKILFIILIAIFIAGLAVRPSEEDIASCTDKTGWTDNKCIKEAMR